MIDPSLYQPSLVEGQEPRKSFNIHRFVVPAMLGGIVSIILLGTVNAVWLKESKKKVWGMLLVGVSLLLIQTLLESRLSNPQLFRLIYRLTGLILALIYIKFLRPSYTRFIAFGGKNSRMYLWGTGSIILGFLVQAVLAMLTGVV